MLDRLKEAEERYERILRKLEDPSVVADLGEMRSLRKEYKALTPVIEEYRAYLSAARAAERLLAGGIRAEHTMTAPRLGE